MTTDEFPAFAIGYAVSIRRDDGSTFLACGSGSLTPVYPSRRRAARFRRDLQGAGFTCRVVPVRFAEPVQLPDEKRPRWSKPTPSPKK